MPAYKGSSFGVVLNSQPYKVTNYSETEAPPLAPAIRQGPPSYADRTGEESTAQVTWHNGFGRGELRGLEDAGRYFTSGNVDARWRGMLCLGPLVSAGTFTTNAEAKVQFIEYNGTFFAIGARYIHSLSGTTWTVDKDMGATAAAVKGSATVFGGNLYVGAGATDDFWTRNSAGTWSQPAAGQKATLMASVGSNLWLVYSGNQLKSSTDGITWTTAVSVGSSLDVATVLLDYNGFPYIGKPDGFYYYDGTYVWNGLPEIALQKAAANCKGAAVARGKVYLPVSSKVMSYGADATQVDQLHIIGDRNNSGIRGTITEFWPTGDFLYGLYNLTSTTVSLVTYDFNPQPGAGWHQIVDLAGAASALGIQASAVNPKAWFSRGTAIEYIVLAANGDLPTSDTAYRYSSAGVIYLGLEADQYDDVEKSQLSVLVDTAGCTANKTVNVYYNVVKDTGFGTTSSHVLLATATTNGIHEYFFPAAETGRNLSLDIRLVTNDSTATPICYSVARRFVRRYARRRQWTFDVVAGRGSEPNIPGGRLEQLVALETARTTVDAVAFIDKDGRSFSAYVESLGDAEPLGDGTDSSGLIHVVLSEKRTS